MNDFTLYPLKFTPIYKTKIWGGSKLKNLLHKMGAHSQQCGESWEISAVENNISVVSNGFLKDNELDELIEVYMGDLVGEKVYDMFGNQLPLLIKFIDAAENLSVQVHPDEQAEKKMEGIHAKTELWYVVQADEGAGLYIGFKKGVTKPIYLQKVKENRVEELLEFYPVKSGDVFFIPGGTIHAIGKGVLLAEIQQSSDTTYRIFDWNRVDDNGKKRALHLNEAEDALDFLADKKYKIDYVQKANEAVSILRSPYFNLNYLNYSRAFEKIYIEIDSFTIYLCIDGAVEIFYENKKTTLKKGESLLIPASCSEISIAPNDTVQLLEIYMP